MLRGLRELFEAPGKAGDYGAVICDVWGVMHDGLAPYEGAAECLHRLREMRKPVILLSNAPRPRQLIAQQLQGFGYFGPDSGTQPGRHYDAIITSGDAARAAIADGYYGRTLMHLGPERDLPLLEGLDLEFGGPGNAQFVLCTGLYDDTSETPADYHELLQQLLRRQAPMLCANPDEIVMRGGERVYCAGALARAYAALGGAVTYFGKPFPGVYQLCADQISRILGRRITPARVLCIGDGLHTDIAGAQTAGLASLLVSGGIHSMELRAEPGAPADPEVLLRMSKDASLLPPDAVIYQLNW